MLWFRATKRLEQLEEDFRKLKRDFDGLELEWAEVYDKVRKSMGRIVKSRAIMEAKEQSSTLGEPADGAGVTQPQSSGRLLTDRQREIQQQILKRRMGG